MTQSLMTRANAFPVLLLRWLRGQLTVAQVQLFRLTGWLTAVQAEEILNTNPAQRIDEITGELEKTP